MLLGNNLGAINWQEVINQGFQFGNNLVSSRYAARTPQQSIVQTPPPPPATNPGVNPDPRGTGLNLFGTNIGYGTLLLVGLGFLLLQSRPLSKR